MMPRLSLVPAVTLIVLTAWAPARLASPQPAEQDEARDAATPAPRYLQLDARVLVVPRDFADDLALDPSPVEALLASDATVISVGELTGQVLAEAAAMHERGRVLRAGPLLAREGQAVSALLAAEPTFVAMPRPDADAEPLPQVSCVLRGTMAADEDGQWEGTIALTGLVLGGIDLALAEPRGDATGEAEALAVPSVRFAIDLPDGDHALLALPIDLTAAFDGPAPEDALSLLLIRATAVQEELVRRDATATAHRAG
jgi:hypothetical protein